MARYECRTISTKLNFQKKILGFLPHQKKIEMLGVRSPGYHMQLYFSIHTTQNKGNSNKSIDRSKGTNTALKEMGAKKKVFRILYGCLFVGIAVVGDHKARFVFVFLSFYILNIALASWQWFFI